MLRLSPMKTTPSLRSPHSSYTIDLRAMSQGRGSYTLKFVRYEEVPQMNQAKIIEDAKKDEEEG